LDLNSFRQKDNILDGKSIKMQKSIVVIMINVFNKLNKIVIIVFYIKKCIQTLRFKYFLKFI